MIDSRRRNVLVAELEGQLLENWRNQWGDGQRSGGSRTGDQRFSRRRSKRKIGEHCVGSSNACKLQPTLFLSKRALEKELKRKGGVALKDRRKSIAKGIETGDVLVKFSLHNYSIW